MDHFKNLDLDLQQRCGSGVRSTFSSGNVKKIFKLVICRYKIFEPWKMIDFRPNMNGRLRYIFFLL